MWRMSKFRIPKINSIHYQERYLSKDIPFDPDKQIAVIKCSICTGEQIAGFRNKEDGHFTEVMLIRNGWIKTSCSPLRKQTSQVKTR